MDDDTFVVNINSRDIRDSSGSEGGSRGIRSDIRSGFRGGERHDRDSDTGRCEDSSDKLSHAVSISTATSASVAGENVDSSIIGLNLCGAGTTTGIKKGGRKSKKGKWVVVGEALNRPPDCCSQRYRDTLIKRPQISF